MTIHNSPIGNVRSSGKEAMSVDLSGCLSCPMWAHTAISCSRHQQHLPAVSTPAAPRAPVQRKGTQAAAQLHLSKGRTVLPRATWAAGTGNTSCLSPSTPCLHQGSPGTARAREWGHPLRASPASNTHRDVHIGGEKWIHIHSKKRQRNETLSSNPLCSFNSK